MPAGAASEEPARQADDAPGKVDAPAAEDSPDTVSILRPVIAVITTVGTPLTMITALLLYFGWARSDAQSRWMGIEVSLFRFTTQDYVLRIEELARCRISAIGVGPGRDEIIQRHELV